MFKLIEGQRVINFVPSLKSLKVYKKNMKKKNYKLPEYVKWKKFYRKIKLIRQQMKI